MPTTFIYLPENLESKPRKYTYRHERVLACQHVSKLLAGVEAWHVSWHQTQSQFWVRTRKTYEAIAIPGWILSVESPSKESEQKAFADVLVPDTPTTERDLFWADLTICCKRAIGRLEDRSNHRVDEDLLSLHPWAIHIYDNIIGVSQVIPSLLSRLHVVELGYRRWMTDTFVAALDAQLARNAKLKEGP